MEAEKKDPGNEVGYVTYIKRVSSIFGKMQILVRLLPLAANVMLNLSNKKTLPTLPSALRLACVTKAGCSTEST